VFLLVDGTRNVHQIAKLLGKPPEEILSLLRDLQEKNVISF
jgi:DNA-binding Lrp family transcriptional regulator